MSRLGHLLHKIHVPEKFLIDNPNANGDTELTTLPESCTAGVDCPFAPVTTTLLIDMLSPGFGLQGPTFPEKVKGLAFGPDLPNHRHVLYVSADNDLNPANPSYIYALAVSPKVLPNFRAPRRRSASRRADSVSIRRASG